jgi:hypothetical protein
LDRKYIQSVKPLTDHVLQVDFISGSRLLLDMKPYLDKFRFRSLSDPQVWNSAVTSSTQTSPKLTVAIPTFKPGGTTSFHGTQTVEISCATPGASIYYTTDGTTPTSSGTAYSGAISLTSTTTIKAIAVKADMNDSAVAAATFTRRSSSGGGGGGGSVSIPDTKIPTGIYEHGTVTVSPKSASKCDTVTPDKGYVLESLTVLDKDGKAFGIWGIGSGSDEGKIAFESKARGAKKAVQTLVSTMKEHGFIGGNVAISHCDNLALAQTLKNSILDIWENTSIEILPTRGLCSYYAERGGLIISY